MPTDQVQRTNICLLLTVVRSGLPRLLHARKVSWKPDPRITHNRSCY